MELKGRQIASLVAAAIVGGYLLATAAGIFLGAVLPLPRGEAVVAGNMLAFAIYTVAVLWVFAVRKPLRAWTVLLTGSALLTTAGLALGDGPW